MGTSPPKPVVELVERFERDRKVFLSPDYKEEQLRVSSGPSPSIRHSSFVIRTSPRESLGWDYPRHLARVRPETGGVLPTHRIRRDAG
jgi:hypothetical protein